MKRNPIYDFKNRHSVGIYNVPLKSTLHIFDVDGRGTPKFLQITGKVGLGPASSVGDLLATPNNYIDLNEVNEVYSELEKIKENGHNGWRILGRNPANYGYIGEGAIDLSYATGATQNAGATGLGAFATGTDVGARGKGSHAEGYKTTARGDYSHSEGMGTIALATGSHATGYKTIARNNFMTAIGKFNTGIDDNVVFEVGVGSSGSMRRNAIQVFDDGAVLMPASDPTLVAIHGPRIIMTKEMVEERINDFSLNDMGDVNFDNHPPAPNQVLKYDGHYWTAQPDIDTNLVQSVNGKEGIVILTTDDVEEGINRLYYTDGRADIRANLAIDNASINQLADVDTTGVQQTQILSWNGANWIPVNYPYSNGNLKSDGSVPMDIGYIPTDILDLVTKEYADAVDGGTF